MDESASWKPTFCSGVVCGLAALLVYYSNERSFLHRILVEQIFWFCTYAWFGYVAFVLPDSPLVNLGRYLPELTHVATVLAVGFLGVRRHGESQAQRMKSSIQREDLRSLAKVQHETVPARLAIFRIKTLLHEQSSLGFFRVVFASLQKLFTGHPAQVQAEALEALERCCHGDASDLCYVVNSGSIDLPQLFAAIRTQDVSELLLRHAHNMDVVTKTRLIDALQRQAEFIFRRRQQELVVQLLLSAHGEELTTMKDLLDEGGDFHNLHKLIFFDLPADLRDTALAHIEREAIKVCRESSANIHVKILSDVDDTLYCSAGHFPAGVDRRFPKGQVYPGSLALFRELDQRKHQTPEKADSPSKQLRQERITLRSLSSSVSTSSIGGLRARLFGTRKISANPESSNPVVASPAWLRVSANEWAEVSVLPQTTLASLQESLKEGRESSSYEAESAPDFVNRGMPDICFSPPALRAMSNLVFLSARPHAYKDYAESHSYRLFRRLHRMGAMHCMPTLLPGRMGSSAGAAFSGAVIKFDRVLRVVLPVLFLIALFMSRSFASPFFVISFVLLSAFVYGAISVRKLHYDSEVWKDVADDKVANFLQYRRLYQEYSTVFFGDNGQGDLVCGEQLARMAKDAGESSDGSALPCVSAVFIHEVLSRDIQLTSLGPELDASARCKEWERLNVYFHRTYVGAAVNAYHRKMISQEALSRVGHAAVEDLIRMRIDCLLNTKSDWNAVIADLNADVERANELLPENLEISLVPASAGMARPLMMSHSVEDFSFTTNAPRRVSGYQ